jgi:hypothetical protein
MYTSSMSRDAVFTEGEQGRGGSGEPLDRVVVPYEKQLDADLEWALSEASRFFEGKGGVQESLRKITVRLDQLGIPYAIAGGMALFLHGYRRFTEVVDLLVVAEDLPRIHAELRGRGYLPPFEKSKQLRDTETKVRIEFLTTGGYPGDGKPKSVAFPDPCVASIEINGLKVLQLERLIELKLASGMSAPHRARDLVDVQELIHAVGVPRDVAERLDPSVREKYLELWSLANLPPTGPDADVFE